MPFDGSNKYDEYSDILNEVNDLFLISRETAEPGLSFNV